MADMGGNGATMADTPGGEAENAMMPQVMPQRPRGGINENYARELMELHTLGVEGGYTQKDVQEVARCLTGWSVRRTTGEFMFRSAAHDDGEKLVLGQRIPAGGGVRDGERVLDILASHPSTARFLARKLSLRLISDTPPQALVDRAAQAFLKSDGDLRVLTRTIIDSPEFWSASTYRAKVKSPFEYAVSAVRAMGGTIEVPDAGAPAGHAELMLSGIASVRPSRVANNNQRRRSLAQEIAAMGQPLYSMQAPTGYPETGQSWVSAGALVARLNFALSLTGGRVVDVRVAPQPRTPGGDNKAALDALLERLSVGSVSPTTRSTLDREMKPGTPIDFVRVTALLLGSPEFQRR
jgi:uncharacterized protein (DUF1800 family)